MSLATSSLAFACILISSICFVSAERLNQTVNSENSRLSNPNSTPPAQNFCTSLINNPGAKYIIAAGFAEQYFYLLANDYTAVRLSRYDFKCPTPRTNCSLNLAKLPHFTDYSPFTKDDSFPGRLQHHYALLGVDIPFNDPKEELTKTAEGPVHFIFFNRGGSKTLLRGSYLKLNSKAPAETDVEMNLTVSDDPVLLNINQTDKYVMLNGSLLCLGSFHDREYTLDVVDCERPIGQINLGERPLQAGFITDDVLFGFSHGQKSLSIYPILDGAHNYTEIPFDQFFDCDGRFGPYPTEMPDGDRFPFHYILLLSFCAAIATMLIYGLFCSGWSRKKDQKEMFQKRVKKIPSSTWNTSST